MKRRRNADASPHPSACAFATQHLAGQLDRRAFLTRATALGLTATAAYGLIGQPAPAQEATAGTGGTLRIQMDVRPLKDPRLWDWPQIANICRGWLEYLVEYDHDGTLHGMLLEGWEASEDAATYTLFLRDGITWSNGAPLTAEDVAWNIRRWCDTDVPGNSMATRMNGLVDPATGQARDGAIELIDPATIRLNLPAPDITLIPNMSDYPAAIMHPSYDGGDPAAAPIGTGPFRPVEHLPGTRSILERNPDHAWWGAAVFGDALLDRIEYIDYGTDPASWLAALQAGEVDMLFESVGEFIGILDEAGFVRSDVSSSNTIVVRTNQQAVVAGARPYADAAVRAALALACDNAILLELGYGGRGTLAENHHVSPIHPEYADMPPLAFDPAAAREALKTAGLDTFEHELISIDDDWRKNTCDAVAAMLRDAGIAVRRRILPGADFWVNWKTYPFSATDWNHRPLGVQALSLAYRSDAAWNETGFRNAEFDMLLARAVALTDAGERRTVMAQLQQILRDEGVIIQPYWRTIYRHMRPGVRGAQMHPSFELHPYALGLEA